MFFSVVAYTLVILLFAFTIFYIFASKWRYSVGRVKILLGAKGVNTDNTDVVVANQTVFLDGKPSYKLNTECDPRSEIVNVGGKLQSVRVDDDCLLV
jgi:hypothetical protein